MKQIHILRKLTVLQKNRTKISIQDLFQKVYFMKQAGLRNG